MKFGVRLPHGGAFVSPDAIRQVAMKAEELDYASVWCRDNLFWSREAAVSHVSEGTLEAYAGIKEPVTYEAITTLSYVASMTKRVRLGIAVLCLPFRNPIVLANQVATLDILSGGRVILGIGTGGWKVTFDSFEIPYEHRKKYMEETFEAMKEIWANPVSTYEGEHIKFRNYATFLRPIQKPHPPIWIGGLREASFKQVVRFGDGWCGADRTPEEARDAIQFIKRHTSGQPSKKLEMNMLLWACIADTGEEARKKVFRTLSNPEQSRTYNISDSKSMFNRAIVGTPNQAIHQIEQYKKAGVSHIQLKLLYSSIDDELSQMERFAREVISSF